MVASPSLSLPPSATASTININVNNNSNNNSSYPPPAKASLAELQARASILQKPSRPAPILPLQLPTRRTVVDSDGDDDDDENNREPHSGFIPNDSDELLNSNNNNGDEFGRERKISMSERLNSPTRRKSDPDVVLPRSNSVEKLVEAPISLRRVSVFPERRDSAVSSSSPPPPPRPNYYHSPPLSSSPSSRNHPPSPQLHLGQSIPLFEPPRDRRSTEASAAADEQPSLLKPTTTTMTMNVGNVTVNTTRIVASASNLSRVHNAASVATNEDAMLRRNPPPLPHRRTVVSLLLVVVVIVVVVG